MATGLASAHFYEGHFDEAVSWADAALAQNPRFTIALRILCFCRIRFFLHNRKRVSRSEERAKFLRC